MCLWVYRASMHAVCNEKNFFYKTDSKIDRIVRIYWSGQEYEGPLKEHLFLTANCNMVSFPNWLFHFFGKQTQKIKKQCKRGCEKYLMVKYLKEEHVMVIMGIFYSHTLNQQRGDMISVLTSSAKLDKRQSLDITENSIVNESLKDSSRQTTFPFPSHTVRHIPANIWGLLVNEMLPTRLFGNFRHVQSSTNQKPFFLWVYSITFAQNAFGSNFLSIQRNLIFFF